MREIIFGNSHFFLTSIFETSAMELINRYLLIVLSVTLTFLVVEEKKNSGQIVSQNDNKPLSGVIVTTYGLNKSGLDLAY
jgi:hypothetical protein